MTITTMPFRRLVAGAGSVALAILGSAAFATAAIAAPGPGQPGASASGSLTIHKHAGSTTGDSNNGTEQQINRPALGGVPFTVTRQGTMVGGVCTAVDLTTSAGWTAAQAIMAKSVTPCTTGLYSSTLSTSATGVAAFSNLALGLYYVTEGAVSTVETPAAPFYVTIPYRSDLTTADGWLYNVHVYPKNTIDDSSDKTVSAPVGDGLGAPVTWTITTRPLGSFNEGRPLTAYTVYDDLGASLTYVNQSAKLTMNLPAGATASIPANTIATPTGAGAGGRVGVTFTDMAALNKLPAGTTFTLTLATSVTGLGSIANNAFEDLTGGTGTATNIGSASTQWGPAQILKHHRDNPAQGLAGAKFSVYHATTQGTCEGDLGAPIQVSGQTEFVSGTTGIVTIAGLWVGMDEQTASRTYCAVEVAPPAGYILDPTPHPIVVKAEATATTAASIQVANQPTPGPVLPLTGAEGSTMLTLAGLALVAIAGGGFMVRRARANH